jgi:hypothetical protein
MAPVGTELIAAESVGAEFMIADFMGAVWALFRRCLCRSAAERH